MLSHKKLLIILDDMNYTEPLEIEEVASSTDLDFFNQKNYLVKSQSQIEHF